MSRVITFSRTFPSYHPRKGERTFFVEKIVEGMLAMGTFEVSDETLALCGLDGEYTKYDVENIKYHTIRAGKIWKAGDTFSPRIWGTDINPKNGRTGPYQSKQIIIADDIEIKKVWDFEIVPKLFLDECAWYINGEYINASSKVKELATNDGLTIQELAYWLSDGKIANSKRKPFDGQIICWNENINY